MTIRVPANTAPAAPRSLTVGSGTSAPAVELGLRSCNTGTSVVVDPTAVRPTHGTVARCRGTGPHPDRVIGLSDAPWTAGLESAGSPSPAPAAAARGRLR